MTYTCIFQSSNNDLWLAAHVQAEGGILVTNKEREFLRVPDLHVENWMAA